LPGSQVGVVPALLVGQKDQHQGGFGNKRLVVAGDRQAVFEGRVGHINDGIEHLIARRGGFKGGAQNQRLVCRADGLVGIIPHRFAVKQGLEGGVHGGSDRLKGYFYYYNQTITVKRF